MVSNRILRNVVLAIGLIFATAADAVGVLPLSGSQQFDKDSSPPAFLTGGQLFIYLPTTTTPAAVFSDSALTVPLASPIVLNTAGRIPPVYGAEGLIVRMRLLSATSVLQFDDDSIPLTVAPISTTPTVITPDQLWTFADVKVRFDDQPVSGYVRCNGRTIGSPTSGAAERANADTESLFKFLWTFANISVVTGKGASATADWSANKQLTLPDCAGRLIAGRDDLGGGVKSRITAATVTGPTLAGAVGGFEVVTLDATMIPAHTHTATTTINNDPGHRHFLGNDDFIVPGADLSVSNILVKQRGTGSDNSYFLGGSATAATIGLSSVATVGAVTFTTSNANTGGGLAHNNMPPVMLFTIYLKL